MRIAHSRKDIGDLDTHLDKIQTLNLTQTSDPDDTTGGAPHGR